MSESQDFHRFVIGEVRVDGWKSDWRRDFEAYRELPKKPLAPRPPVVKVKREPAPKKEPARIKPPKRIYAKRGTGIPNAEYMRRLREKLIAEGLCTDCHKVPAREKKTTCESCQVKRTEREMKRYYAKKAA